MNKFWIYRLADYGYKFNSLEEVKREAEAYARKHKVKVYVMEAVASCVVEEPVKWES